MLNKFFKAIHNKYARLFKFIFFLRYLFTIFFISIVLFLIIPTFFNYEKKEQFIKDFFLKDYNFRLDEYQNIKYKAFPAPRIELKKVKAKLIRSNTNLNVENLKIYPKLLSIYKLNNFEARKIIFKENAADLEISNLIIFVNQLLNQKKKNFF